MSAHIHEWKRHFFLREHAVCCQTHIATCSFNHCLWLSRKVIHIRDVGAQKMTARDSQSLEKSGRGIPNHWKFAMEKDERMESDHDTR